jgi:hypothetical protein
MPGKLHQTKFLPISITSPLQIYILTTSIKRRNQEHPRRIRIKSYIKSKLCL